MPKNMEACRILVPLQYPFCIVVVFCFFSDSTSVYIALFMFLVASDIFVELQQNPKKEKNRKQN